MTTGYTTTLFGIASDLAENSVFIMIMEFTTLPCAPVSPTEIFYYDLNQRLYCATPRDPLRPLSAETWFDCCPIWSLPGFSARRWAKRNGEQTPHVVHLQRVGSRFCAGAIRTIRRGLQSFLRAVNSQSQPRPIPHSSRFVARQSINPTSLRTWFPMWVSSSTPS